MDGGDRERVRLHRERRDGGHGEERRLAGAPAEVLGPLDAEPDHRARDEVDSRVEVVRGLAGDAEVEVVVVYDAGEAEGAVEPPEEEGGPDEGAVDEAFAVEVGPDEDDANEGTSAGRAKR